MASSSSTTRMSLPLMSDPGWRSPRSPDDLRIRPANGRPGSPVPNQHRYEEGMASETGTHRLPERAWDRLDDVEIGDGQGVQHDEAGHRRGQWDQLSGIGPPAADLLVGQDGQVPAVQGR